MKVGIERDGILLYIKGSKKNRGRKENQQMAPGTQFIENKALRTLTLY
jgi:hypothetical protein